VKVTTTQGVIHVVWQILPHDLYKLFNQSCLLEATDQELFTFQFLTEIQLKTSLRQFLEQRSLPLNRPQQQAQQQEQLTAQPPVAPPPSGQLQPPSPKQEVPAAVLEALQLGGDVSDKGKENM
jgi:hypothetical protein